MDGDIGIAGFESTTFTLSGFDPTDRAEWPLADGLTYLNHGTVGVTPNRILNLRAELLRTIEADPAAWVVRGLADIFGNGLGERPRMRAAVERVAGFVGVDADGLGFVRNITEGANAVLGSIELQPGDEVLITSLGYGGVDNAARFHAQRSGASVVTVEMPPVGSPAERFVAAVSDAIGPRTRIAVIDHLAANSALLLPVADIVAACRQRGVITLIDGAHVPGAVPLNIVGIGADFYTANLHKWAWAPRPVGIVWAAPQHRASLHPPSISWGLGNGLAAQFDFPGTIDPSPFLVAPAAIDLLSASLPELYEYNHSAAIRAGEFLSQQWGTEFATPPSMLGPMVALRLPDAISRSGCTAVAVQQSLRSEGVEVPVADDVVPGALTVRVSFQRYVTSADVERLAAAVANLDRR